MYIGWYEYHSILNRPFQINVRGWEFCPFRWHHVVLVDPWEETGSEVSVLFLVPYSNINLHQQNLPLIGKYKTENIKKIEHGKGITN